MVLCDNCGHDNKETAKFCHSCGTKIEITEPVPAPKSSRLFKIGRKSRQQELKEYEKKYLNEPEGKKTTPTEVPEYGKRTKMRWGIAIGGAILLAFGLVLVVSGSATGFAGMCFFKMSGVRCYSDGLMMMMGWAIFWIGLIPTIFGIRYVAKA